MAGKIISFIFIIFCLLINAAIAFQLDFFGENTHSNDGWTVFGDSKITTCFSVISPVYDVLQKPGDAICNSYDLSKGKGLEISFKHLIKKESMNYVEKKNGIQSFVVILSKKFVKNWTEANDKKIMLLIKKI